MPVPPACGSVMEITFTPSGSPQDAHQTSDMMDTPTAVQQLLLDHRTSITLLSEAHFFKKTHLA